MGYCHGFDLGGLQVFSRGLGFLCLCGATGKITFYGSCIYEKITYEAFQNSERSGYRGCLGFRGVAIVGARPNTSILALATKGASNCAHADLKPFAILFLRPGCG